MRTRGVANMTPATRRFGFVVNGDNHELDVTPDCTLLDVVRENLGLTGTKEACGRGECGACTVLLDGLPVLACVMPALAVHGEVITIEGLAESTVDLRAAFADAGAFQCGFCTPGQLVTAWALLVGGAGDEQHVREGMSGNICRCTGYGGIVSAILATAAASERLSTEGGEL